MKRMFFFLAGVNSMRSKASERIGRDKVICTSCIGGVGFRVLLAALAAHDAMSASPSPLLHSPPEARVLPPEILLPALHRLAQWEQQHATSRHGNPEAELPEIAPPPEIEPQDARCLQQVPRREALSYAEFWRDFMYPNSPVLISGLADKWKARAWRRGGGDEATGKGQEDGAHRESVNETVCKIPDVLGGARKKVDEGKGKGQEEEAPGVDEGEEGAKGAEERAAEESVDGVAWGPAEIDFELMEAIFGDDEVCVALCGEQHYSDQRRETTSFREFVRAFRSVSETMEQFNRGVTSFQKKKNAASPEKKAFSSEIEAAQGGAEYLQRILAAEFAGGGAWPGGLTDGVGSLRISGMSLPYCKDWHLVQEHATYGAYALPTLFGEDFLNSYYDILRSRLTAQAGEANRGGEFATGANSNPPLIRPDDYRFCYMGPRGTWTPLHRDVLRSYSWSCNIVGRKLWIMYPPQQDRLLRSRHGDLPWDVTGKVDSLVFPTFSKASPLIVVQHPGETLFVPSGWLHQVVNLDHCVSINHNWLNSCNILHATTQMLEDHTSVKRSICDCSGAEDFPAICERLLLAHAGMNLSGFSDLLTTITDLELHASPAHTHTSPVTSPAFAPPPHASSSPESPSSESRSQLQGRILSAAFRLVRLRQAFRVLHSEQHVEYLVREGLIGREGVTVTERLEQGLEALFKLWLQSGGGEHDPPPAIWFGFGCGVN